MYSDSPDRAGRVRQIPINIEPRSTASEEVRRASSRQQHQSPNNNNDRHYQENQWRRAHPDNSYSGNDPRQTSPNTSSVNINYQPQQTQRNQNHEPRSANSQNSRSKEDRLSANRDKPANQHQNKRSPSPRDVSPNSEKKVNSPEPIPLPPPQCQTQPNDHTSSAAPSDANTTEDTTNHQSTSSPMSEEEKILSQINSVKLDITNLLERINQFKETSASSKEYRYLDEMLTRCVLNLDKIECGNSADMRQQRRAAIKLVDQTTNILQRKVQINADILELSVSMSRQ